MTGRRILVIGLLILWLVIILGHRALKLVFRTNYSSGILYVSDYLCAARSEPTYGMDPESHLSRIEKLGYLLLKEDDSKKPRVILYPRSKTRLDCSWPFAILCLDFSTHALPGIYFDKIGRRFVSRTSPFDTKHPPSFSSIDDQVMAEGWAEDWACLDRTVTTIEHASPLHTQLMAMMDAGDLAEVKTALGGRAQRPTVPITEFSEPFPVSPEFEPFLAQWGLDADRINSYRFMLPQGSFSGTHMADLVNEDENTVVVITDLFRTHGLVISRGPVIIFGGGGESTVSAKSISVIGSSHGGLYARHLFLPKSVFLSTGIPSGVVHFVPNEGVRSYGAEDQERQVFEQWLVNEVFAKKLQASVPGSSIVSGGFLRSSLESPFRLNYSEGLVVTLALAREQGEPPGRPPKKATFWRFDENDHLRYAFPDSIFQLGRSQGYDWYCEAAAPQEIRDRAIASFDLKPIAPSRWRMRTEKQPPKSGSP